MGRYPVWLMLLVAAPGLCQSPPDLQGIWTNATVVPLERPANLKGKEFFTDAEAALKSSKLDEIKIATSKLERVAGQLTSAMLDPEADAVNSES